MNGTNTIGQIGTGQIGTGQIGTGFIQKKIDFNFSVAFKLMLEGQKVSRRQFGSNGNLIYCRVQKFFSTPLPDGNSLNTLPYIMMVKTSEDGIETRFPVTLSPESMFAEDWYTVI